MGHKSRQITCYDVLLNREVSSIFCVTDDRPHAEMRCMERHCSPRWLTSNWTEVRCIFNIMNKF